MPIKNRQQFLLIAAGAALVLLAGDRLVLSPLLKAWGQRAARRHRQRLALIRSVSKLIRGSGFMVSAE